MKRLDVLIAILVAIAWGTNFSAVKFAINEVPGFLALALRFLITALILLPFAQLPKISFAKLYLASLIFGVFYVGLLYYGMYLGLNVSLTIILMQLNIPISIIIARIYFKEQFTLGVVIGIALAFLGMLVVLKAPHAIGNYFAIMIIILSAFFCALFNIQNRVLKEVPPLSLLCWTSLISVPHLFVISYFIEGNPFELIKNTTYIGWMAIIYGAIVAGTLGISLWIYLLQKYPVNMVLPFNLLVPFFGVSISILLLKEIPSWHIIFGGALTLCGIAITQMRRQ